MAWRDYRSIPLTCVLLLLGLLAGCASPILEIHMGHFTVGSTKNVGQLAQKGERVQGKDCFRMVLFIPLSWPPQPSFKWAIDDALEKTNGDVLVEAVLSKRVIFTFIYNEVCDMVEAYAARAELRAPQQ